MGEHQQSHQPPSYTTYMVEDEQILTDMGDVERQLQVETSSLAVDGTTLSALSSQHHVGQVMVGNQMMNLLTAGSGPGGHAVNVAPGSRVVLVNSTAMLDSGGRVVMSGDSGESLGVVVVSGSVPGAINAADGGPISIVSGVPISPPLTTLTAPGTIFSGNAGSVLVPYSACSSSGAAININNTLSASASANSSMNCSTIGTVVTQPTSSSSNMVFTNTHTLNSSSKNILKVKNKRGPVISSGKLKTAFLAPSRPSTSATPSTMSGSSGSVVPHHYMDEFTHQHHLTKSQVEGLFMILGPHYTNPGRRAPLKDFVLASLVLLSTKDSYREMSERMVFKSRGWMHKTIHLFCQLMVKHLSCLIEWPSGNDVNDVVENFENIAGFPGVIGAMDSYHMALTKAPVGKSNSFYSNHMQFHSIHLLAVSDHRGKFTYVNVGRPGSFHESKVFKTSSLCQIIENDPKSIFQTETHIVANSSFPLSDQVMTAYGNSNGSVRQQKHYNSKLLHTKQVVDNTVRLLRARWQRLKCLEMQKVTSMIIAVKTCCILHNICIHSPGYDNRDYTVEEENNLQVEYIGTLPFSASRKRDMIAHYLEGQVQWSQ